MTIPKAKKVELTNDERSRELVDRALNCDKDPEVEVKPLTRFQYRNINVIPEVMGAIKMFESTALIFAKQGKVEYPIKDKKGDEDVKK